MRVRVDRAKCHRYGICVTIAPDVFDVDDDGFAIVQCDEVAAEHEDAARRAARSCPESAITVDE
jgi:ferredoxin